MKNIAKINWRVSVALLLAALMSLTLVVACGGNASGGDVADSGEPDATADTTAPSAPATSEDTEPLTTGERFLQAVSETEIDGRKAVTFSANDLRNIANTDEEVSLIGLDGEELTDLKFKFFIQEPPVELGTRNESSFFGADGKVVFTGLDGEEIPELKVFIPEEVTPSM